jgi:hypothetical protein
MCGEFAAFQIAFFIIHVRNLCAHLAYFVIGGFIFGRAKYKPKVRNENHKESDQQRASQKKRNRAAVPLFEKFIDSN